MVAKNNQFIGIVQWELDEESQFRLRWSWYIYLCVFVFDNLLKQNPSAVKWANKTAQKKL